MIVYTAKHLPDDLFELPIKNIKIAIEYEDESPSVIKILIVYNPILIYHLFFGKFVKNSIYRRIKNMIPFNQRYKIIIKFYFNILGYQIEFYV